MKRPISIPVIGCLYIAIGLFLVLSTLFMLTASAAMRLPNAGTDQFGPASNFVNNFALITFLPLLPAVLMVFAGAAFLGLRPWSRLLMEILAWIGLIIIIGNSISSLWGMYSLAGSDISALPGYYAATMLFTFGLEMIMTIPVIIVIYILRSRSVRDVFNLHSI